MSTVIKAKISKLLDRAEDPGVTLDYGYQKQVELLQKQIVVLQKMANLLAEHPEIARRRDALRALDQGLEFDPRNPAAHRMLGALRSDTSPPGR